MQSAYRVLLLLVLAAFTCGFGDGGSRPDMCPEAYAILSSHSGLTGDEPVEWEDRILRLCPDGAPGHFVKGVRLEREGEADQAIAEYRRALAVDDSLAEVHGNLGLLLLNKGMRDEAAAQLAVALSRKPDPRFKEGLARLFLYGNMDSMQGLTNEADPGGYIRRGDTHLLAREYGKAIAAYQAALRERPGRADILQKLADAQMVAGHDEQAADLYRKLLSGDSANSSYLYTLGILYERQGMLDEAEEQYRRVVLRNPANSDARRHLADIYTLRGNFPHAIREYRELLIDYSDNPLLHFKLARVYERDKKYPNAIAEYLEAIKHAPDNIEVHKELAALYRKRGKWAEAEEQYRAVLRLDKNDIPSRHALIPLYVKLRKYDELFSLLKEEVELFPNNPDSHYRLGLIYDARKQYDLSIAEYQKALNLKKDHAKSLKGLGKAYLRQGNLERAREFLEAAKKADPKLLEASELFYNLRIEQSKAASVKSRSRKAFKMRAKRQHKKETSHHTNVKKKYRKNSHKLVKKTSHKKKVKKGHKKKRHKSVK